MTASLPASGLRSDDETAGAAEAIWRVIASSASDAAVASAAAEPTVTEAAAAAADAESAINIACTNLMVERMIQV